MGVTLRRQNQFMVYDPALIDQPNLAIFEPGASGSPSVVSVRRGGRDVVYFLRIGNREYVLRHYWRGGQAARLSRESYLWIGADRSRPFREWRLLDALWQKGLPVPRPAAARVVRSGLVCRGDILIERLADTQTLAELATQRVVPTFLWESLGRTIRQFHDAGADHGDLNAGNVLINSRRSVFLIDWDRGRLRRPAARWQKSNLARLARSLAKCARRHPVFHYSDNDWKALLRGYDHGHRTWVPRQRHVGVGTTGDG